MTASPSTSGTAASGNICFVFEETVKLYPDVAQTIAVERRTGSPGTWMLGERPRTANELYAAIKKLHGRNAETTYAITFKDRAGHGGSGELSMPSTLDEPLPTHAAPGQPPQYPYPPHPQPAPVYQPPQPAYAQPPQPPAYPSPQPTMVAPAPVDPVTLMQETFRLFQQMHSSMQPAPQPQPQPQPAPVPTMPQPPPVDPVTMMQETFRLIQQMHSSMQPAPQPQPAPAPQPQMPPPPPQGSDPATMIAWMQEVARLFQQMRSSMAPPPAPAAAPPQQQPFNPQMMGMPPIQAPPGTMFVPGFGFVPVDRLFAALSGPTPGERGPYAGPRSAYAPPGSGSGPGERPPYQPPQPPQRQQTPFEQLREAATVLRSTIDVAREFGFGQAPTEPEPQPEVDDGPVRVIDMGKAKGVINRSDGSLRGFETVLANMPDIINWVGKNVAEVRKATAEREQQRQQQQERLPPGYVRVGQDYQPPEGFVAVPVDQIPTQAQSAQSAQQPLPEPPTEMPPPLAVDEPPPKTWGMPQRPRRG
jgi:hypothetical protein